MEPPFHPPASPPEPAVKSSSLAPAVCFVMLRQCIIFDFNLICFLLSIRFHYFRGLFRSCLSDPILFGIRVALIRAAVFFSVTSLFVPFRVFIIVLFPFDTAYRALSHTWVGGKGRGKRSRSEHLRAVRSAAKTKRHHRQRSIPSVSHLKGEG